MDIQDSAPETRAHILAAFGPHWQSFVGEVMDTLPGAVSRAPAPAPPAPGPAAQEEQPVSQEEQPVDRAHLARTTQSQEELAHYAFEADDDVFESFLDNPAASAEQVASLGHKTTRDRIIRIARHQKWFAKSNVREALLKNPNTPEDVALRCLSHVGRMDSLSRLLRDPRVRSLAVKAGARQRLVDRYRALSVDQRVSSIKASGGQLLQDLWKEAFSDRQALKKLLSDRGLDEAVAVRVARSRIAPREALLALGNNRNLLAKYQVCLELAMNPKTPREVLSRVVPRLTPADRARLRQSRSLTDHTRSLAGHA
jgi:hypothetical protein